MNDGTPLLSPLYSRALSYAATIHARQTRKGTEVPYISHPLSVSALVLEYGGNETEAIAALLHDAIEDCRAQVEDAIRQMFGDEVAAIVLECTDGTPDDSGAKAPWKERKERYIAHLESASESARLVSACDKLHNARSILRDAKSSGQDVFDRFKAGKAGTLWYYRTLADAFARFGTAPASELSESVGLLETISG